MPGSTCGVGCHQSCSGGVERGKPGESYILSGGNLKAVDRFNVWFSTPGGTKVGLYMPKFVARLVNYSMEPLLRLFGLPPIFSAEVFRTAYAKYLYTAEKATRELEMEFRSPEQAWRDTLQAERTAS